MIKTNKLLSVLLNKCLLILDDKGPRPVHVLNQHLLFKSCNIIAIDFSDCSEAELIKVFDASHQAGLNKLDCFLIKEVDYPNTAFLIYGEYQKIKTTLNNFLTLEAFQ